MKTIIQFLIPLFFTQVALGVTEFKIKETVIKKINQRFLSIVKTSTVASVFLVEDLIEASEFLVTAKIKWPEQYSGTPYIFEKEHGGLFALSSEYSFKTTDEKKLSLLVTILFQLKRQLEGSYDPIPEFRIELFAKKFAPIILSEKDFCGFSIEPINFEIDSKDKESFFNDLLKLARKKEYQYDSRWANWVLWIEGESFTANSFTTKAVLINWQTMTSLQLGEAVGKSNFNFDRSKRISLKKLMTLIEKNFPDCHQQVGQTSKKEIL